MLLAGLFMVSRAVALAGMARPFRGDIGTALWAAGSQWDSGWYQMILSGGYGGTGPSLPKAGFYPGYPLLASVFYEPARAIATRVDAAYAPAPPLTPSMPLGQDPLLVASLLLAANLSLVLALVVLWRLYEPDLGRTAALLGCGLLLTAPSAFFLSAAFAESTFIAATALAVLLAERGRWLGAGLAGAAACLTRQPGIWLVLPLGLAWLAAPRPRPTGPAIAGLGILVAGAAAFPAYCLVAFGDALLYVHLQASRWGHRLSNPLRSGLTLLRRLAWAVPAELRMPNLRPIPEAQLGLHYPGPRTYAVDGLAFVAAGAGVGLGWLQLRLGHVAWIGAMIGFPLLTGGNQLSMNRYVLAAWPVFFLAGWLLRRRPVVAAAIMAVDAALMFVLAGDHAGGQLFVG